MKPLKAHHLTLHIKNNVDSLVSSLSLQLSPSTITLLLGHESLTKTSCLGSNFKEVGIVVQDAENQFTMTKVEEELLYRLQHMGGIPAHKIVARIDEVLELLSLQPWRHANIQSLSGGMKKRLSIACTLALRPEVLILDEQTSNLDPLEKITMAELIHQFAQEQQMAVLLIDHQLNAWMPYVDELAVMGKQGQLVYQGDPIDYFTSYTSHANSDGIWRPTTVTLHENLQKWCDTKSKAIKETIVPLTVDEITDIWLSMPALVRTYALQYVNRNKHRIRKHRAHSLPPLMELFHLSFGNRKQKPIIKEVNLTIQHGQFIAVVGANDSGKSTLGSLMAGIIEPIGGEIQLNAIPLTQYSATELRGVVGMIAHDPEQQFVTDSVYEELAFSMREYGLNESSVHERVIGLLEQYRLFNCRHANPATLSEGQKRRLRVATMLTEKQQLLICEEPTYGQDPISTGEMLDTLSLRVDQGMSVLMITHDIEIVEQYCDRVIVLDEGELVFDGTPTELWQLPDSQLTAYHLHKPVSIQLAEQLYAAKNLHSAAKKNVASS